MIKRGVLVFGVLALACSAGAIELRFGGFYGARTIDDAGFRETFGTHEAYEPFLRLDLRNGLGIGIGYESTASSGTISSTLQKTRMSLRGWEAFLSFALVLKSLRPYARAGFGTYVFAQTIDDQYMDGHTRCPLCLPGYSQNVRKSSLFAALGLAFAPVRGFELVIEGKYLPLQLKLPAGSLDLGGWRFWAGLAIAIGL